MSEYNVYCRYQQLDSNRTERIKMWILQTDGKTCVAAEEKESFSEKFSEEKFEKTA